MAADDVSPAPIPALLETHEAFAILVPFFIGALVVMGVLALLVLHVLGSLRRRSSHRALHAGVVGAYTLSYSLVSYTLGLMQSSKYYVVEFPVWAVCLLLLLGSTDCLTACSLSDIDNWKSLSVRHVFQGLWVVWIVAYFGPASKSLQAPLWAILFVIVLRSYARIASMKMASKSYLLCKNMKRIADYMQEEDRRRVSDQRPDPVTMRGYRYVVAGERRQKFFLKRPEYVLTYDEQDVKITTVEQIWLCQGSLLDGQKGLLLKDICLSMALSKMLNRRFAGFELAEAGLDKTHDFVFRGLLVGDKPYERAFRVIEEELAFVHDLYYTRYPYLYHKGWYFTFHLPFTMIILCIWVAYRLLKRFEQDEFPATITTMILMVVVALSEVFQLYLYAASGWCKVVLIKSYVTRPMLQRVGFFQILISLLLMLRTLRPWENKLGQYSLLHAFDGRALCLVDEVKKGRKREKLVKLSRQVKQAVIASLVDSKGRLTNGVRSLQNNHANELLSDACGASNRTTTHTILIWHIATTLCKHKLDAQAKDKQQWALSEEDTRAIDTASMVASSLSRYCAYLIAFEPDLLPDHNSVSALVLGESIKEARELLEGAKTMTSKCEKLMSICSGDVSAAEDVSLVVQGARLARKLNEGIQDPTRRWRILSEFWAEMMLYVVPSDNARAHLEGLARGGEFITHLWALLTHAGVLERDRAGPQAAV